MSDLITSIKKCRVEGNIVHLPAEQIPNYAEVKKALEKASGKYKRSTFVFPSAAQPFIDRICGGEKVDIKKEFQFYCTQPGLADTVVKLAHIEPWHIVLEPSAGQGSLIEAVHRKFWKKIIVDYYELMDNNRLVIEQKCDEKTINAQFVGIDFMIIDHFPYSEAYLYDRIIANPPFSKNQDIDHIRKMYERLRPGGRIVSIASTHWIHGKEQKCNDFRLWIESIKATVKSLPAGEFKKSGTSVASCIVIINKPS